MTSTSTLHMGSAQAVFDAQHWLQMLTKQCGLSCADGLSAQSLSNLTKDRFSSLVVGAVNIMGKLHINCMIIIKFMVQVSEKLEMRNDLLKCQSSVKDLQKKLLDVKGVQLQRVTSAVTEKVREVKNEVQSEFRSLTARRSRVIEQMT